MKTAIHKPLPQNQVIPDQLQSLEWIINDRLWIIHHTDGIQHTTDLDCSYLLKCDPDDMSMQLSDHPASLLLLQQDATISESVSHLRLLAQHRMDHVVHRISNHDSASPLWIR